MEKIAIKMQLLNEIRKPPMFAEKTLVILKEASQFKELALLEPYLEYSVDNSFW